MSSKILAVIFLLFLTFAGLLPVTAQFRGHAWGLTEDEVIAIEGVPDDRQAGFSDSFSLVYEDREVSGLSATIFFTFCDGRLCRGRYHFRTTGNDYDAWIDFPRIDSTLFEIYGEPAIQNYYEVLRYLEYDRRSLEGWLRQSARTPALRSVWRIFPTMIVHSLFFNRGTNELDHTVSYRSLEYLTSFDRFLRDGL